MHNLTKLKPGETVTPGKVNRIIDVLKIVSNISGRGGIVANKSIAGIVLYLHKKPIPSGFGIIRRAKLTQSAGADDTVAANLYDDNGVEVVEGEGYNIECHGIIMGDTTQLNSAVARLESGKDVLVTELPYSAEATRWYIVGSPFQKSHDCEEDFTYYGDPDTDGSYRIGVVGGAFKIQKREAGTYNSKLSRS